MAPSTSLGISARGSDASTPSEANTGPAGDPGRADASTSTLRIASLRESGAPLWMTMQVLTEN